MADANKKTEMQPGSIPERKGQQLDIAHEVSGLGSEKSLKDDNGSLLGKYFL